MTTIKRCKTTTHIFATNSERIDIISFIRKKDKQSFDKQIHNLSKMKKNKTIRKNMEFQYSSKVCEKKVFIKKTDYGVKLRSKHSSNREFHLKATK